MRIVYCASEVHPFAKTGGLADVAGSLPLALGDLGHEVVVLMPKYKGINHTKKKISKNACIYFIKNKRYFDREGIYGSKKGDYSDNLKRFDFFCFNIFEFLKEIKFRPDILHLNDWHTGLASLYLKEVFQKDKFFKKTKSLFTIHNLAYQGLFSFDEFRQIKGLQSKRALSGLEFYGKTSLIKAGIVFSDWVSTVSSTYASEIQTKEHGCGLEKTLRKRGRFLSGILNGIDSKLWDPKKDKCLKNRLGSDYLNYKKVNKKCLQKRFGLPLDENVPVFGVVSRLAEQKGFDLFIEEFERFIKKPVQFVLLGQGEKKYESFFQSAKKKYKNKIGVCFDFANDLAPLIYAGSDFFLIPSRFEPCGLGQMISFRYGAIPIVRQTGGLADSVFDISSKKGNGIVFKNYKSNLLLKAVDRAIDLFEDRKRLSQIQKKNMKLDFSWKQSAKKYVALYKKMLRKAK